MIPDSAGAGGARHCRRDCPDELLAREVVPQLEAHEVLRASDAITVTSKHNATYGHYLRRITEVLANTKLLDSSEYDKVLAPYPGSLPSSHRKSTIRLEEVSATTRGGLSPSMDTQCQSSTEKKLP